MAFLPGSIEREHFSLQTYSLLQQKGVTHLDFWPFEYIHTSHCLSTKDPRHQLCVADIVTLLVVTTQQEHIEASVWHREAVHLGRVEWPQRGLEVCQQTATFCWDPR